MTWNIADFTLDLIWRDDWTSRRSKHPFLVSWLTTVILFNFQGWVDFRILSHIFCLCCLYFYARLTISASAAVVNDADNLWLPIFYYHLYSCSDIIINDCIEILLGDLISTALSPIFITKQANIHYGSASKGSFSTGLDIVLDFCSSSNVFCFSTITGSKSLESRSIDNGYDVSLGHVKRGSNPLGFYLQFLISWEAIVRDQSIDKCNTFHSCG